MMNEAYARRLADSYLSLHERDDVFCVVLGSKKDADSVSAAFRQRQCAVVEGEDNLLTVTPPSAMRRAASLAMAASFGERARLAF